MTTASTDQERPNDRFLFAPATDCDVGEPPVLPVVPTAAEVSAAHDEEAKVLNRLLLTPTEAAAALGIGRSKLYELLGSGVVPSITIGACRRIIASDLSAVIESLRDAQARTATAVTASD
jgi:excisionase family DNA binding protein